VPVATSLERPLSSGRRAARAVVRAIPLPGTSQCAAPSIATAGPAILAAGGLASRLASMAPLAADGERVADLARLAIGVALARLDDSRGNPAADVAGGRRGLADSSPVAFGDLVAAGRSERAAGAAGRPRMGRRSWTRRARAVGCGSSGTARQQQSQSDAGGRRKNGTCALAFGQGDGERYTGSGRRRTRRGCHRAAPILGGCSGSCWSDCSSRVRAPLRCRKGRDRSRPPSLLPRPTRRTRRVSRRAAANPSPSRRRVRPPESMMVFRSPEQDISRIVRTARSRTRSRAIRAPGWPLPTAAWRAATRSVSRRGRRVEPRRRAATSRARVRMVVRWSPTTWCAPTRRRRAV